jgi:eukaryotic-like serine/threonine-protein kinase
VRCRLGPGGKRLAGGHTAAGTALACLMTMVVAGTASPASASPAHHAVVAGNHPAVTGNSPAYNWSTFHQAPSRQGYARNSPLSTANAPTLGVAWATDLYAAATDSPVVAYDASLGETLAYIGTEHGDVLAVNVATGRIVWGTWLGSPIRATPVVFSGSVWVGTYDSPRIYKLNASTGVVSCSVASPDEIEGTPVAATPPGGTGTVYFGTNDVRTANGPILAVAASNCAIKWSFTGYTSPAGSWVPISYGVDAANVPLIVFGTSDPDSTVYAVNAVTGAEVWHFATNPPPGDYDVGAGAVISPPGANGFADGVVYVENKYGTMFALDLTTGTQIWSFNYNQALGISGGGVSMAALAGKNLVLGIHGGLVDINALTGTLLWHDHNPANIAVDSSPAIAGATGSQIVAVGDLAGGFDIDSLATGAQLYHYQTGNYITASPAVTDGNILVASADGFLYDFAAGGGNETSLPGTTITSPADSSTLPNPAGGQVSATGAATDQAGVSAVEVAVQESGPDGSWWDATSGKWVPGPIDSPAVVDTPGATASTWHFSYPVPAAGGTYKVTAYTVSTTGQSDITAPHVSFTVGASTTGPQLTAQPAFVAPGGSTTVAGGGFQAGETVAISLLGTTLVTATATSSGALPATKATIPATAAFGLTSLTATGQQSGQTAAAAITIANNWAQLGNGPGHPNLEPNDSTFYNNITPGARIFLDPAWVYQSSSPIGTAPAIADSVAYTADSGGQLAALDVHNGAPLWTWTIPSGAALDGSPAADPKAGLVFVGAQDGTLAAISAATGKLVWSAAIGGDVSAPVYGAGDLYVTTSTGAVEAVAESTGATVWGPVTLPSSISSAPSLDPVGHVLIVGESSGDVVALNSATGATLWTYASGGAVTASATVYKGSVYFGSGDAVDAVTEATGSLIWSYPTGGAVGDTPSLTNKGTRSLDAMVGSADGNLYVLQASDGSLAWQMPVGSPIAGVATVSNIVVYTTTSGLIGASRSYGQLLLWTQQTGGGLSPPVIVNGAVYAGGQDSHLYAFTPYGQQPSAVPQLGLLRW